MRIDVVGLTLAETALVLLFALFAVLLSASKEENQANQKLAGQVKKTDELSLELKSEREKNADLSSRLTVLLPKLRSAAFPSCAETGKATGWLFSATVEGNDQYEIDGKVETLSEIVGLYSRDLKMADEAECRQRIKLFVGNKVSGADYEYAMRKIGQYFYVGYMGPR